MTVLGDEGSLLTGEREFDGEDSSSPTLFDLEMVTSDESDARDHSAGKRSSPPPDIYEFFFPDISSASASASATREMCAADEIFIRCRFIPSNPIPPQPLHQRRSDTRVPTNPPCRGHLRSESLDSNVRSRGRASEEYRKLRRASSDSDPKPPPTPKPRPAWYLFCFGSVRVPVAMEMKDMRMRQSRRGPRPLAEATAEVTAEHSGPWRLIRSLSCKAAESAVAAAAPVSLVSHVRRA